MEKLSDVLKEELKKKQKEEEENKARQWHLRQWYIYHYHHERFYLIEMIGRDELDVLQNMETKKQCWLLPHEMRTKVNELRLVSSKNYFNWPGFNEAKQQNYGVGIQAVDVLKEHIKSFINNCNFNKDECDEYNWHIIDNVLFENRGQINYRTIKTETAKASKLL